MYWKFVFLEEFLGLISCEKILGRGWIILKIYFLLVCVMINFKYVSTLIKM